ncbi:hypothetical protein BGZ49_000218 [Haplosporangium sp. Z 27]|nr:hypothetical protein BGZ49_000218 [Haplosporangium sp. Z 27]
MQQSNSSNPSNLSNPIPIQPIQSTPKYILLVCVCFLCEDRQSYSTPHNLRRHLTTKHGLSLPARRAGQSKKSTKSIIYINAATATETTESHPGIVEHFVCPSCCFDCAEKADLKSHVDNSHTHVKRGQDDDERPAKEVKRIKYDQIDETLKKIIAMSRKSHHPHYMNEANVEQSQREIFGRFFKSILPYGHSAADINLPMLGKILDMEPTISMDNPRTLLDIIKEDASKSTDHCVVALIARSGSGKTATIVDLAKHHFVVYVVCTDPHSQKPPGFQDPNFDKLAKEVNNIHRTVHLNAPESFDQVLFKDRTLKDLIEDRVNVELLARLLFLLMLFDTNDSLSPEQFFREQTSEGISTIGNLVEALRVYDTITIRAMFGRVQDMVSEKIGNRGLAVALDEAHIADEYILKGQFIAPSAMNKSEVEIMNAKLMLKSKYCRGFLTPLCTSISKIRATLIVLGTSLSLGSAEHVYSAIGKPENFLKIVNFPLSDKDDVEKMLKRTLNLDGCVIDDSKKQKLCGRARFGARVIKELTCLHDSGTESKQQLIDKAMDRTIRLMKDDLVTEIESKLEKYKDSIPLLCRMVMAFKLQHGRLSFPYQPEYDFVNNLCALRRNSNGFHWVMDEPLVIDAVEEVLRNKSVDASYLVYLQQLDNIIQLLGLNSTTKGNVFEPLIRRSLQRFNGFALTDLPFLRGLELPDWCNHHRMQINEINTAEGFGYGSGVEGDLNFLVNRPTNKLLEECSGTRQDGVWFFDNEHAGSLAIKLYSSSISKEKFKENDSSSDIRLSFLSKKAGKNDTLKGIREKFDNSQVPTQLKGILRIHFLFPRVQDDTPTSYVLRKLENGSIVAEDVMVYIDCSNMGDFFDETLEDQRGYIRTLMKLVNFVAKGSVQ